MTLPSPAPDDLASMLAAAVLANRAEINAEVARFSGPFVLEIFYRPAIAKVEMVLRPTRRLPDFRTDAA